MISPPISYADDLALAARIVNGDEATTDDFARKYSERFAYLARRAGVPRQDCNDVAQEALLAALSQLQRGLFRGDSQLSSWLARIAYGKAVDYHRSRRGLPAVLAESEDEALEVWLPPSLTDYELVVIVREALAQMPQQYRIILLLKRTAGFTLEEISRKLELSVGQVSNKLYTAEKMFRAHLRGEALPRKLRRPAAALLPPASSEPSPAARRQGRRLGLNIPRLRRRLNAPRP